MYGDFLLKNSIEKQSKIKLLFEKQHYHILALFILLVFIYILSTLKGSLSGTFMGISTSSWFILSILSQIIHQFYVWLFWRIQLYYNKFEEIGFKIYVIGFFILFIARFFTILFLATSNSNSLVEFQLILWIIAIIITFPSIYTFYSVKHYFGALRASGADHFDSSYWNKPMVKEGIFKYTNNGMYWFGLLVLWIPGLVFTSLAALEVALFTHLYIWVHYFTVEKPDMNRIYKK
ncbi:MAG: hypothetical protein HeimC3_48670 [Candidatus Heimdallarchaeota archaeon LC_3]|nr:MAG: hypothetical protein HeimC3_48670 [Candidatus Heimdallarchaeota archaeon LC_3]